MVVAVTRHEGTERATHRIQYGARIAGRERHMVKRGQRMPNGVPITRPV